MIKRKRFASKQNKLPHFDVVGSQNFEQQSLSIAQAQALRLHGLQLPATHVFVQHCIFAVQGPKVRHADTDHLILKSETLILAI